MVGMMFYICSYSKYITPAQGNFRAHASQVMADLPNLTEMDAADTMRNEMAR